MMLYVCNSDLSTRRATNFRKVRCSTHGPATPHIVAHGPQQRGRLDDDAFGIAHLSVPNGIRRRDHLPPERLDRIDMEIEK
jgi:hypothetical protein